MATAIDFAALMREERSKALAALKGQGEKDRDERATSDQTAYPESQGPEVNERLEYGGIFLLADFSFLYPAPRSPSAGWTFQIR